MIWAAKLLGLAGLLLATALLVDQGIGTVFSAVAAAGLGTLWAALFHLVPMLVNARAWQLLAAGAGRPGLARFTWWVWMREAVNGLLPVARVGGEVVAASLMMRHGMRRSFAVASLVVDMTLSVVTQFFFTLIGLALLVLRGEDGDVVWQVAIAALLALPIIAAFLAVQRFGLFGLFARLVHALAGERWAAFVGGWARLDRAVLIAYRRVANILRSCAWQLAAWVAGAGEIWLCLYFLGHPVSLADALMIEAAAQAISSAAFVVPGAIGVQEGGFVLVGALVGIGPETALALAVMRRARDLILYLPPLVIWQLQEGRLALGRR
ncbi:MAG: TIGR00374 family protein [Alphaproteobacteria bacterium]|nr:TIGR00374 family protein [Alphaproteobacteria bacterium]